MVRSRTSAEDYVNTAEILLLSGVSKMFLFTLGPPVHFGHHATHRYINRLVSRLNRKRLRLAYSDAAISQEMKHSN